MATERWISWSQVVAIIGSVAALGGIHAGLVVPAILDRAEIRASELDKAVAATANGALQVHLDSVETIRAGLVTRGEFELLREQLATIQQQLDRIEDRLSR